MSKVNYTVKAKNGMGKVVAEVTYKTAKEAKASQARYNVCEGLKAQIHLVLAK